MLHVLRPAAIALVCIVFVSQSARAKVYVEQNGTADREDQREHRFEVTQDSNEFKLTVSAKLQRAGHLRIYFYEPSPRGGWAEVQDMRVVLRETTKQTSTTFKLPRNRYKIKVSVRRAEYTIKLEDAAEE